MAKIDKNINALISLLEDEDQHVSSMAMEQLLQLDGEADPLVAEFQESHNPLLRGRIHQLGNILNYRRSRTVFIDSVNSSSISLWDGVLQINQQFSPRINREQIDKDLADLAKRLPDPLTPAALAAFMRKEDFAVPVEVILGADLYLAEDVLEQRTGSAILLSVMAQQLGTLGGLESSIVLMNGVHCLIDRHCHLIEPADNWRVKQPRQGDTMHPCSSREVWMTVLSQLFVAAVLDGGLQSIHRVGTILCELSGGKFGDLPYPLGL